MPENLPKKPIITVNAEDVFNEIKVATEQDEGNTIIGEAMLNIIEEMESKICQMKFSNEIIKIEHPIYLFRYSLPDGTSPYALGKWDLQKPSVVSLNGKGVYGILLDEVLENKTVNIYMGDHYGKNEIVLVLLESSKEYIIINKYIEDLLEDRSLPNLAHINTPDLGYYETSVSQANIIGTTQNGDFKKLFELAMANNIFKGRPMSAGLENTTKRFTKPTPRKQFTNHKPFAPKKKRRK